jgi:hypothetical protein
MESVIEDGIHVASALYGPQRDSERLRVLESRMGIVETKRNHDEIDDDDRNREEKAVA